MQARSARLAVASMRRALVALGVSALVVGATAVAPAARRLTFAASARKHVPVRAAHADALARFFECEPADVAADALLGPTAYEQTGHNTFACALDEVRMLGYAVQPSMRLSLGRADGGWSVRTDELTLGGSVGGALRAVSFDAETRISWEPSAADGRSARLCSVCEISVSFEPPPGFRERARGPVERLGGAALGAAVGTSMGASLQAIAATFELWRDAPPLAAAAAHAPADAAAVLAATAAASAPAEGGELAHAPLAPPVWSAGRSRTAPVAALLAALSCCVLRAQAAALRAHERATQRLLLVCAGLAAIGAQCATRGASAAASVASLRLRVGGGGGNSNT